MDYNAPSGSTNLDADYVGATASTQGSKLPPSVPTLVQRELVNVELLGGLIPANGDRTQVGQAIGRGLWLGTLGASPNALVGTLGAGAVPTKPGILQTLNPWTRLRGLALQTNTQASVTLTVVGIGSAAGYVTAPLLKRDGSALAVGDVPTLYPFTVQVDATGNFRMEGSVASDGVTPAAIATTVATAVQGLKSPPYINFTAGTYTVTVPAGVSAADLQIWGGGGGGGGCGSANNGSASGGGGGGYSRKFMTGLTPGQQFTLVIGAGGNAGGQGGPGGAGATTTFGSVCSATGGGGGSANSIGTGGAFGSGQNGDINLVGGYGSAGLNSGYGAGGPGGAAAFGGTGGGGAPGIASSGCVPGGGGGGSGAAAANNGTTGAPGGCLILWK